MLGNESTGIPSTYSPDPVHLAVLGYLISFQIKEV